MDWIIAWIGGVFAGAGIVALYLGGEIDNEHEAMCNVLSGQYSTEDNRCYATIDGKTKGLDHKGMLKQMEAKHVKGN